MDNITSVIGWVKKPVHFLIGQNQYLLLGNLVGKPLGPLDWVPTKGPNKVIFPFQLGKGGEETRCENVLPFCDFWHPKSQISTQKWQIMKAGRKSLRSRPTSRRVRPTNIQSHLKLVFCRD